MFDGSLNGKIQDCEEPALVKALNWTAIAVIPSDIPIMSKKIGGAVDVNRFLLA